jgi:hypothetical protein
MRKCLSVQQMLIRPAEICQSNCRRAVNPAADRILAEGEHFRKAGGNIAGKTPFS